jgi:phosphoribosyl 1,2-cyclic phosphate phosphodiesterase
MMRVTVLGCGSSGGVPLIGCECRVCRSEDPRDKRTRPSILVEEAGQRILVDTGPDLRVQCLANGIRTVDAIIYTHEHADHVHGIDDVRSLNYNRNAPIPAYAPPDVLEGLCARFPYVFRDPANRPGWFRPALIPHPIDGPFAIGGVEVVPFPQWHGRLPTLGLRFGRFAYSTDTKRLPDEAFAALEGVEVWIVDCLGRTPNPAHANLPETLAWIARVRPRLAVLTHMNHSVSYRELIDELPDGVVPGHDGMVLEIEG